ncbi:MAG: group II intron reverse transcriptase/maturase [Ilumatobacteraceae bacterium]
MKSSESRQLKFVFADNSRSNDSESDCDPKADESVGRSYLLHTADTNLTNETDAPTDEPATSHERLLEYVASLPNLARALLFVARNKGAAGVDGISTKEVVEAAPDLLPRIHEALISGTYQPGDIRRVWIPKPGGGERGLGIPNVIDRVVQQAVLLQLEPIFEPTFHDSSHGFRRYRGAQTAIAEATKYFNEGYGTTVDIDLSKFFDRVHHQRLLARMGQRVRDGRVLKLVHRMLKAKVVLPDGTRVVTEEGTPQGGPLSPLLSNIVLDELDWELDRRGLRFVRYADDFSVFVRSERSGHRVMASVQRFIERSLRLVINEEKSSVSAPFDLTFLGFWLGRDNQGEVSIRISRRTADRLKVRIRELTPRSWGGSFDSCVLQVNRYLNGLIGYFRLCTGTSSFDGMDARIRRRLRAILVRQKKRPRHLFRHLIRRGISHGMAWKSAYGIRGHWKRSASFGIHKAYGNAWFAERLVNLRNRWHDFHPVGATKQLTLF